MKQNGVVEISINAMTYFICKLPIKFSIKLFFVLLFSLNIQLLYAQPVENKSKIETERKEIQKEIKEIEDVYSKVKGEKKQLVGQLSLIEKKINLQNKYINNISKELRYINDDIYLSNIEIYRLQKLLDTLKQQYARSVTYAYKNRSTYDYLNFIFSANSFNDASKRIEYLKSYRAYREQQVDNIYKTSKQLAVRKDEQLGKRKVKDGALKNQTAQAQVLVVQKKEKDKVISGLKSKEKDLEKQLTAKRKKDRELKNIVDAIIKREILAAKNKNAIAEKAGAATKSAGGATSTIASGLSKEKSTVVFNSEVDLKLTAGFENNRGKLPWPVDEGYVCMHFGPYQVGDTKLKGENSGTTICTPNAGVSVKSVFEGEVFAVFNIADTKGVMIRHGKYFTIYSNLLSVIVSKNMIVKTGQTIGKLAVDEMEESGGKLEFVMMIETKKVNPEIWLRK